MQKVEFNRVKNERLFLEQEHARLLDERRHIENEEHTLLECDRKETEDLAGAAVKKAQRESKVREEVYALSKTRLAEEREAWLLGKRSTAPNHLDHTPHEMLEEARDVRSSDSGAQSKAWWDILPKMPNIPMPNIPMPSMPAVAMPKVDLTEESKQADRRNLANIELVLDMDMAGVGDHQTFKCEVEEDVAAALGPAAKKCCVTGIRAGSVIVDLEIELADGVPEQVTTSLFSFVFVLPKTIAFGGFASQICCQHSTTQYGQKLHADPQAQNHFLGFCLMSMQHGP